MDDTSYDAIDLFAGPGGWDVGARDLGLKALGIEFDAAACKTRRAAGLPTIEGDVRDYGPADFPGVEGFIASPPCQTFSMAGKGAGRAALDDVLFGVKVLAARQPLEAETRFDDVRTGLVLEPLRWALEAVDLGAPFRWLAFEQVPTVLPVWEAMADVLRGDGYSVEVGKVQAEQYGVPQTRKRAILVARLDGEARLPTPTHSRYYSRNPEKLDAGVLPWVSMAEALGWGATARPSMTVTGGGAATGGAEPFGNMARQGLAQERDAGSWAFSRPSTTIVGSFRPEIIAAPGWRKAGDGPRQNAPGSVRVTPEEAATLQSFPPDHPWQGSKSKIFQQIGNAVPPLLARAVLAEVTGRPFNHRP